MHPRDCPGGGGGVPGWDYEPAPNAHAIILQRVEDLLIRLRADCDECSQTACDTRSAHEVMFAGLTPTACECFAGNYRGSNHRCLQFYTVHVPADPRVGHQPEVVDYAMTSLSALIAASITSADSFAAQRSRRALIRHLVKVAARMFEMFCRIHPYANGNGHAARLLVCALLGRYDVWMKDWTVEPRPRDPNYSSAISDYRTIVWDRAEPWSGPPLELEKMLLRCIAGTQLQLQHPPPAQPPVPRTAAVAIPIAVMPDDDSAPHRA